ncbi:MAG TPA: SAM-dependent methyltransferase [Kribbellaceae bacterium]|nr:SAM-dependent methyltransferase [Kribbellaceae bacterium]
MDTFRDAWQSALYGPDGFYRRNAPADHFRTSVHASPLFATAMIRLAERVGATTVTDIGAGRCELAAQIEVQAPGLTVRSIELDDELPERLSGLVIANEWLDNVPCEVAELSPDGRPRYVLADGNELGDVVDGNDMTWLEQWWPLAEPGDRAEIGTTRDAAWAEVVRRLEDGLAVAIDYGHTRDRRPPYGSLIGYAAGRVCAPVPDGSCDLTAHVAVDAVAAAVGGVVQSQRDVMQSLGITAARPALDLATSDPQRYVRELSAAGEAAELLDPAGLGGFAWISCQPASGSPTPP